MSKLCTDYMSMLMPQMVEKLTLKMALSTLFIYNKPMFNHKTFYCAKYTEKIPSNQMYM